MQNNKIHEKKLTEKKMNHYACSAVPGFKVHTHTSQEMICVYVLICGAINCKAASAFYNDLSSVYDSYSTVLIIVEILRAPIVCWSHKHIIINAIAINILLLIFSRALLHFCFFPHPLFVFTVLGTCNRKLVASLVSCELWREKN